MNPPELIMRRSSTRGVWNPCYVESLRVNWFANYLKFVGLQGALGSNGACSQRVEPGGGGVVWAYFVVFLSFHRSFLLRGRLNCNKLTSLMKDIHTEALFFPPPVLPHKASSQGLETSCGCRTARRRRRHWRSKSRAIIASECLRRFRIVSLHRG